MKAFKECKLILILEFGAINDKTMSAEINCQDQHLVLNPGKNTIIEHVINVKLPATISIILSDKDMATDTIVDSAGQIIKDKHVKLNAIRIDGLDIPYNWLEKKIVLDTRERKIFSNYFGHNGQCLIELSKLNSFLQILEFFKET